MGTPDWGMREGTPFWITLTWLFYMVNFHDGSLSRIPEILIAFQMEGPVIGPAHEGALCTGQGSLLVTKL